MASFANRSRGPASLRDRCRRRRRGKRPGRMDGARLARDFAADSLMRWQLQSKSMRVWNRAKLLWGYLRRRSKLNALPVEYIVETTAKCNLYCPMCPRETHPQPKEDMTRDVFERLVTEAADTAEHMMLIGLGEPFMDPQIFPRIEFCHRHSISTLLSTNGTF